LLFGQTARSLDAGDLDAVERVARRPMPLVSGVEGLRVDTSLIRGLYCRLLVSQLSLRFPDSGSKDHEKLIALEFVEFRLFHGFVEHEKKGLRKI
jgi:hypothetical protein